MDKDRNKNEKGKVNFKVQILLFTGLVKKINLFLCS